MPKATRRDLLRGASWTAAGAWFAGGEPAIAQGRPRDLGSLMPLIESQAKRLKFPLSFTESKFRNAASWRKQARGRLLELLHYAPEPVAPRVEVIEKQDFGTFTREKIVFSTAPDVRVPAYVLAPKNVKGPAPAVVALHDHGGFYQWGKEKLVATANEHPSLTAFKAQLYGGRSVANELVSQGYVVIATDMFYWGERRMRFEGDPQQPTAAQVRELDQRCGQNETNVARVMYATGMTWSGLMFGDDVRTVDYLLTRPDVDPKRIACVGLSVGAVRSMHLAALDDRVKAAVVVCWMTSFQRQLELRSINTIGFTKLVPGLYHELDYPDVAALAIPRAMFVMAGRKDGLFPGEAVDAAFGKLATCYKKAGAADRLVTRWYDVPHEFNAQMQAEAWAWLRKWV